MNERFSKKTEIFIYTASDLYCGFKLICVKSQLNCYKYLKTIKMTDLFCLLILHTSHYLGLDYFKTHLPRAMFI